MIGPERRAQLRKQVRDEDEMIRDALCDYIETWEPEMDDEALATLERLKRRYL